MTARLLACGVILSVACVLSGCSTINRLNPKTREAAERAQQRRELQLKVMRFADEYVGRTTEVLNHFQLTNITPAERLSVQNWKVQQADSAYVVASGPNPVSNALDMIVLATLSRMVLDDAWVGETYGARALPVQQTYRDLESESWQLLTGMVTPEQTQRLREIITQWRAAHPNVRAVATIHFRDFAKSVGAPRAGEESTPGNLFSMLGLDPMAGLDPAVQEITQTRELAERAIYYVQRMPTLLDMQVERLTYQLAVMPETRQLLGSIDRVSLIGSASERMARTLPDVLDRERAALVADLQQTLNVQSDNIGALARELHGTLDAGTATANALRGALDSAHQITSQFAPTPGAAPPKQQGPPFDIRNYTEMLRQATETAREINALTKSADAALPVVRTLTQDAAGRLNQVVNHLFVLLLLLVLAAAAAATLAAVAYRRIMARLERHDALRS
ncbi:MAG TPA: hypothetical protein VEK10_08960 [Steroidobacteraceae bacterium]|nr:hypothetical protein [Steroidobacteraceae bacterium]